MKKLMMIIAVIVLAAIVVSPAMAYKGMWGGYGSGPGNVADIAAAHDLNLTAEQTEKINTLREAYLKEIKPLRDQLYGMRGELRSSWLQTTPDRDKITTLQRDAMNLRNRMEEKMNAHRLDLFQVLTPEQQAKVQADGAGRGIHKRVGYRR
jgi:Spy/CpxP family protein refolding chaperone